MTILIDTDDSTYYTNTINYLKEQYKKNNNTNNDNIYDTYGYEEYLNGNAYYDITKFPLPDNLFSYYLNYCSTPTIETATELFTKLKIPIPLQSLLNMSEETFSMILERKEVVNKTGGGESGPTEDITTIYKNFVKLDFLHDLSKISGNDNIWREKIVTSIINDETNIDQKNKQKIINDFKNLKNNTIYYFIEDNK